MKIFYVNVIYGLEERRDLAYAEDQAVTVDQMIAVVIQLADVICGEQIVNVKEQVCFKDGDKQSCH